MPDPALSLASCPRPGTAEQGGAACLHLAVPTVVALPPGGGGGLAGAGPPLGQGGCRAAGCLPSPSATARVCLDQ